MKKVMFIAPAKSIHTQRWVTSIAKRGWKVFLISLPDAKWENPIEISNLKIVYLPIAGKGGYYLNALALYKIYINIKPDVINVHYASGYGTLARIAKLPDVILSVWGSDVYEFPYQSKIKNFIIRNNIKYAKKVASTSYCMARQANKVVGEDLHCTITPFGVDINLFKHKKEKNSDKFIFGIIKTLEPKYGINYLIDAYSIFVKNTEGAKETTELRIYGDGADKEILQKQACSTNLPGIYFGGKIVNNKVPDILNDFDVFCCSSISDSESFGVAAVEAMACELPVIATDVDGFKEVIEDGINGVIVPRKDPEAMAEKMLYFYDHHELVKNMGKVGRMRVIQKYNWENNVNTMLELYESILHIK